MLCPSSGRMLRDGCDDVAKLVAERKTRQPQDVGRRSGFGISEQNQACPSVCVIAAWKDYTDLTINEKSLIRGVKPHRRNAA
jgi:hypothetical protein